MFALIHDIIIKIWLFLFRYGMVGVCASDYSEAGGWDSKWGYHWGAEDVDFINRVKQHVPYIARVKEQEHKHVHSGENRKNAM